MSWYFNALSLIITALVTLVPGVGYFLGAQPQVPETIRRTLPWPGSGVFELSNINGSVHIVAEDRRDVSIVATRTVERVGSEPEPTVDFRQDGERVLVCGDARRCGCHVDWPRNERRTATNLTCPITNPTRRFPRT